MKKLPVITLLAMVVTSPSIAARHALLVANNRGGSKTPLLQYVENDARQFQSLLTTVCGFEPNRVATLYNGTPNDLDQRFDKVVAALESNPQDNLFLFYYSGHADRENLKMGNQLYPLSKLKEKFASFPAEIRIGVFDACQSGIFTRLKGGQLAEPFLFKSDTKVEGQVILSSSSANENSQESDLYRHSIFTFHFLNALRGSGDMSGDGRVTVSEAYQYSYNRTVSTTASSSGGVQHPAYQFQIQGEGDIVLADLNIRTTGIVLATQATGHFTVTDPKHNILADLKKESGSTIMIAVSPGTYQVINHRGTVKYKAIAKVDSASVCRLAGQNFVAMKTYSASQKGGKKPLPLSLHISISNGADLLDWSALNDSLTSRYRDYQHFGMNPSFTVTSTARYRWGLALETWLGNRYQCKLGFSKLGFNQQSKYHGAKLNPMDSVTYGYYLNTQDTLCATAMHLGVGYRFRHKWIQNVSLHLGYSSYNVQFKLYSAFRDSLYDIALNNIYKEQGSIGVPYVGIRYTRTLWKNIDINIQSDYRYQNKPKELSTNGAHDSESNLIPYLSNSQKIDPLRYDFGGLGVTALVCIRLLQI